MPNKTSSAVFTAKSFKLWFSYMRGAELSHLTLLCHCHMQLGLNVKREVKFTPEFSGNRVGAMKGRISCCGCTEIMHEWKPFTRIQPFIPQNFPLHSGLIVPVNIGIWKSFSCTLPRPSLHPYHWPNSLTSVVLILSKPGNIYKDALIIPLSWFGFGITWSWRLTQMFVHAHQLASKHKSRYNMML